MYQWVYLASQSLHPQHHCIRAWSRHRSIQTHPSPEREFNLTKALFASSWILNVYILNSHYTNFRWILLREIEVFAFFVFFEPIFTWIHWDKRSYGPDYAVNRPQMTLKHFPWVYYMIICHVGPTWTLFRGPRGPHNGPKQHPKWPFMTKNGPSWPKMSLYEPKWP